MSTPLLGPKKFRDIRTSLIYHATDEMDAGSCSMKNGEISRAMGVEHPFGQDGIESAAVLADALVFDWARLNHAAHVACYGLNAESEKPSPLGRRRGQVLSLCALLKSLQCVRYNCDGGKIESESMKESLAKLDKVIGAITMLIIGEIPEYKEAAWF